MPISLPAAIHRQLSELAAETGYSIAVLIRELVTPETVNKLAAEIKTIVANPDVRERFYSQGIEPVYATPEEFAGYIKMSVAKYAKVIKALGLKVE